MFKNSMTGDAISYILGTIENRKDASFVVSLYGIIMQNLTVFTTLYMYM